MSRPEVLDLHRRVVKFDALYWRSVDFTSMMRSELHLTPRTYSDVLRAAISDDAVVREYPDEVRRIRYRLNVGRHARLRPPSRSSVFDWLSAA